MKINEIEKIVSSANIKNIPRHIGFIMDGNGRWATMQGLDRTDGHAKGAARMSEIIQAANVTGVKAVTFYAFSTENWKRPKKEVDYLMKMPIKFFGKYLAMLDKQNIVINAIGRLDELPKKTSNCIIDAIEKTRNNTGLVCTIAINYGSRDDIVRAVNRLIEKGTAIDEHDFAKTLSTGNLPEVDLLVRTSGEKRLSNFLLWELSYAEFIFTKTMWPDYDANELMNSIGEFSSRNIRKGGL